MIHNIQQFVKMVKEDKYDKDELPNFTYKAIPVLLKYANDFSEITNFPTLPISSFQSSRLTVGECLLWTIEAIRQFDPTKTDKVYFPSWVAQVWIKGDLNTPYLNDNQLTEVYNLYKSWWENNTGKDFEITKQIDPLKDSVYSWK